MVEANNDQDPHAGRRIALTLLAASAVLSAAGCSRQVEGDSNPSTDYIPASSAPPASSPNVFPSSTESTSSSPEPSNTPSSIPSPSELPSIVIVPIGPIETVPTPSTSGATVPPAPTGVKLPAGADESFKIAQLLNVGFDIGSNPSTAQANMRAAARLHIGGTFLTDINNASDHGFGSSFYNQLNALDGVPLFTTNDDEGGEILRDKIGNFPSAQEMGKMTAAQVKTIGKRVGKTMRQYGVLGDLAPVLDVPDTHPNGAISPLDRSFAGGSANIASKAGAFLEGLQESGEIGVVKHFPGIGEATPNSNTDLYKAKSAALATLERNDIPQYRTLINKGDVKVVMISNEFVTGLDSAHPASLSTKVVSYLRKTLHFNGVITTDSLTATTKYTHESLQEVVADSLNAGVDMPLFSLESISNLKSIISYVKAHVPITRINAALAEVLALKTEAQK